MATDAERLMLWAFIIVTFSSPIASQYISGSSVTASGDECGRPLSAAKMDLFFVVDSSSSVHEGNFTKMLEFVASIIEKLTISENDTRVGLLQYNSQDKLEFSLNAYTTKRDVLEHVRNVRYMTGVTYTGKAIKRVLDSELIPAQGYRPQVPNVIIVLTDGLAQDDVLTPSNRARDQGVVMFSIGITYEVGQRQLLEITGYRRDHVFLLDDFESFNDILSSLEHELENSMEEECRKGHASGDGSSTAGYYAVPWGQTGTPRYDGYDHSGDGGYGSGDGDVNDHSSGDGSPVGYGYNQGSTVGTPASGGQSTSSSATPGGYGAAGQSTPSTSSSTSTTTSLQSTTSTPLAPAQATYGVPPSPSPQPPSTHSPPALSTVQAGYGIIPGATPNKSIVIATSVRPTTLTVTSPHSPSIRPDLTSLKTTVPPVPHPEPEPSRRGHDGVTAGYGATTRGLNYPGLTPGGATTRGSTYPGLTPGGGHSGYGAGQPGPNGSYPTPQPPPAGYGAGGHGGNAAGSRPCCNGSNAASHGGPPNLGQGYKLQGGQAPYGPQPGTTGTPVQANGRGGSPAATVGTTGRIDHVANLSLSNVTINILTTTKSVVSTASGKSTSYASGTPSSWSSPSAPYPSASSTGYWTTSPLRSSSIPISTSSAHSSASTLAASASTSDAGTKDSLVSNGSYETVASSLGQSSTTSSYEIGYPGAPSASYGGNEPSPQPDVYVAGTSGDKAHVEIRCDDGRIQLALSSPSGRPFTGWAFVKGHFDTPSCRFDFQNNTEQHIFVLLKYDRCGMLRQRSSNPTGVSFSTTVVFMRHRQFITEGDRAYRLQCFYMEADKTVTQSLDVSMMTTASIQVNAEMPACQYTLREGTLRGPQVKTAVVGMTVVHRWDCEAGMNAANVYGMKLHTCYVKNNQGKKALIVDETGCAVDKYVLDNLKYTDDLMTAFVESSVFKFADSEQVFFDCQISLCVKLGGGCDGFSPPNCTSPLRGKRFADDHGDQYDSDSPYYGFDLIGETVFVVDTIFEGQNGLDSSGFGQIGVTLRPRSEDLSTSNDVGSVAAPLHRSILNPYEICLTRFSFFFGAISLLSATSITFLACILVMCVKCARSGRNFI